MQNPAIRIANHLGNLKNFNPQKNMLENFKAYFGYDKPFEVIFCLYMINKDLDEIEKFLVNKGKKTSSIERTRKLFDYTCLTIPYNNLKSINTDELREIFDGYSLAMDDETLKDLDEFKEQAKSLYDEIDDPLLRDIMDDILNAIDMYPCAGPRALLHKLAIAGGRLGLYIQSVKENPVTKRIAEIISDVYQMIRLMEKIEKLKEAGSDFERIMIELLG